MIISPTRSIWQRSTDGNVQKTRVVLKKDNFSEIQNVKVNEFNSESVNWRNYVICVIFCGKNFQISDKI